MILNKTECLDRPRRRSFVVGLQTLKRPSPGRKYHQPIQNGGRYDVIQRGRVEPPTSRSEGKNVGEKSKQKT